jgi:hypothetical protein
MGRTSDTAGKDTGAHRKSQLAAGTVAAATMVLAFAGATLTSTASGASAPRAHKTPVQVPARLARPAGEQFRVKVERMLNGLRGVAIEMQANPATAKALSSTGTNLLPMIAAAEQEVAGLNRAELGQLRASLNRDPNWQQAPRILSAAVALAEPPSAPKGKGASGEFGLMAVTSGTGTFTDDCASAGDPYLLVPGVLAANQVQSALQAAALAAPGVLAIAPFIGAPTGVRLGLMVAWGIANGIYMALAQTLEVAVDCAETAFGNLQESTLSHDPANSGTVVPTSTQFSIDRLIAKAGDSQTKINAVQTTVQTVKTQTDSVDTSVTALNNILDDITGRVEEVQTGLQTLQTRVDVLKNTEVTILKKADTLIANLGTLERLQLRMAIEQNLDKNDEAPIALFQLPAAFGGHLEFVRTIVTETLAKRAAVGNPSAQATAFLNSANAAFAAGEFKTAYVNYRKAYGSVG